MEVARAHGDLGNSSDALRSAVVTDVEAQGNSQPQCVIVVGSGTGGVYRPCVLAWERDVCLGIRRRCGGSHGVDGVSPRVADGLWHAGRWRGRREARLCARSLLWGGVDARADRADECLYLGSPMRTCGQMGRAGWRCTLERAVPAAPAIALAAAATWGLSLYMEKL